MMVGLWFVSINYHSPTLPTVLLSCRVHEADHEFTKPEENCADRNTHTSKKN